MTQIEDYAEPEQESNLAMAPSGGDFVIVSERAHVSASLKNRFDKQQKAGKNFGRVKFLGTELATFTVSFEVLAGFEEEEFYRQVVPLLRRKGRRGVSPPFDIVNLQIQRLGIETVTIVSAEIGPPDAKTGRIVTILLEEWAPAPVEPKKDSSKKVSTDPLSLGPGASAANQS
jgi:hypothetical protein